MRLGYRSLRFPTRASSDEVPGCGGTEGSGSEATGLGRFVPSVCELWTSKLPSKMVDVERESGAGLEREARRRTGWQRPVEPQGRGFFSGKGRAKVWKWPWGVRRRKRTFRTLGPVGVES